jgi:1,4-dihydroxy-2-naphthoate octaprenyltransferase
MLTNTFYRFNYKTWVLASRPKTLLAAFVPVMVGSALAVNENKFVLHYSLIALICAVLIQIGTNFTNDLYDYLKGADNEKRKGPLRVLASGLISVREMKAGIMLVFGLTFLFGLYLVYIGGVIILTVGILSIITGLAYTAGPFPLSYNGLGDIFVFIFFGIIGTVFTYYLHTLEITPVSFLVSIPVGALITNILIVNNYRDINEDKAAGKKTLAAIFGKRFSRYQFSILLIISFIIPLILFLFFDFEITVLLPLLIAPLALRLIITLNNYEGAMLNRTLENTAKFSALYGILFSAGLAL